jgi:hypothetical protein
MDFCPSGTASPLDNRCGEFETPLVLQAAFNLIGSVEISAGFGAINLFGDDRDPIAIFDRGCYFNGINNRLRITGLVINSSFSVLTWLKYTREAELGINPIFSLDSPIPEGSPGSFNVFFETGSGLFNSLSLNLKI